MSMAPRLVVLTLNIWGLLLVSRRREERVASIARQLADSQADVVALQEVWVSADAVHIAAAAADRGLIHSHHFKSGLFGPGLLLLSRYAIVDVAFYPFAAAGDPTKFFQGDFYGAKGIGHAKLRLPDTQHPGSASGGPLYFHVLVTHTHANYEGTRRQLDDGLPSEDTHAKSQVMVPLDEDAGFRLSNMVQLGHLASALSSSPHSFVIVTGDLNSRPDSLELALFKQLAPCLTDPWEDLHPSDPGFTCNVPSNSWSKASNSAVRIDYVLSTKAAKAAQVFSNHTPGGFSQSDHEALQVEFEPWSQQPPLCSPHGHKVEMWEAAADSMAVTAKHLRERRVALLVAASLFVVAGVAVFAYSFWGHSASGAWAQELRRRLFETPRVSVGGRMTPGTCSTSSSTLAQRRLRAFLLATTGTLLAFAGFVMWLIAYLGLTGQQRAIEDARSACLMFSTTGHA